MTSIRFLTALEVKHLHRTFINKAAEPTQPKLLESAIDSPLNANHYAKEGNIHTLAANLAEKIMKNHAFQDGNKRTGLLSADVFLRLNGRCLVYDPVLKDSGPRALADVHARVVTGDWDANSLGDLYARLSENVHVPTEGKTAWDMTDNGLFERHASNSAKALSAALRELADM